MSGRGLLRTPTSVLLPSFLAACLGVEELRTREERGLGPWPQGASIQLWDRTRTQDPHRQGVLIAAEAAKNCSEPERQQVLGWFPPGAGGSVSFLGQHVQQPRPWRCERPSRWLQPHIVWGPLRSGQG